MKLSKEEQAEVLLRRFQKETDIMMKRLDKCEDMHQVADIYQELTDFTRETAKAYDELEIS